MKEVLFKRGLKRKYDKTLYSDAIYFATDTKEIIVNGISYGSVDVDDALTEIGQNPVKGSAIYKAIKDNISESVDNAGFATQVQVINTGNNIYQILLLDKNGNILSTSEYIIGDQSGTADLSGLQFSYVGSQELQVRSGQQALLDFIFDVRDSSGASLGRSGTVSLYLSNNNDEQSSEPVLTQRVSPGRSSIDVTEYLNEEKVNYFWLKATAETDKGTETKTIYYKVSVVNLSISCEYNVKTVTTVGNIISIPVSIVGPNKTITLRAYLDGVEAQQVVTKGPSVTSTININTSALEHGTHNIQLRADYDLTDTDTLYSNIIYLDVAIIDNVSTTPVFSCRFDYEDGKSLISGTPIINVKQYDLFTLNYYVWSPESSREVEFYSENKLIGSNTFSDDYASIKYKYISSGIKNCYFECNGEIYDFIVNVEKSNYEISDVTSGLTLYLDALGKFNSSSSRDSWTYNDITSTFENFNWSGNGWTGESLKLFNNSKVTIHHQPFKSASSGALTFAIRFKVSNASDPNEVVISCVDKYGYGLVITAQEAKLKTRTGEVSTKFATDQIYNIGFVSFPSSTSNSSEYGVNNSNMCYIYVDGIISGGIQKTAANEIYQIEPQDITLQASNCELEVYSIRSYSSELTDDQMFDCYLIDLTDSNLIGSEYEQNDVLSIQGNVTPDKVYGKIPYFIITGKSSTEGLSQFEYAAIQNNKNDKYDVDSILYVDTDPAFNFICIPNAELTTKNKPQIRLQGTSSMGYPRKNYRIYTKQGVIYQGCDKNGEGGQKLSKPKYSMSSTAVPVNCWCLKADFAESSSSHNTGTTGLVEEVLAKAQLYTPAQENVNKETYPYQVRTTVEGKPCLLFFRSSEDETPQFGGKFNFNNDKSTEDVFGFLNIPGYNDTYAEDMALAAQKSLIFPDSYTEEQKQALINSLEGNPTECWEFLNNNTLMGQFLEADFNKIDPESSKGEYYWVTSWEARFPDLDNRNDSFANGVKPYYLMNIAKWITSTNADQATNENLSQSVTYGDSTYIRDTAEYRLAKFKYELSNYFDVDYLCAYYLFTDCLAAADQRVKNMMWGIWYTPDANNHEIMGKMRCYPIFYDNDTILGLDNTGKIALNWDADENTTYGDGYAFAGHNSTIWNNLRSQFASKLEEVYLKLRNNENMTNSTMLKWYNTNQSDKYCERVYNKDSLWKYIIPTNVGVKVLDNGVVGTVKYPVLSQMQGSRRAHRTWFINNRMDLFDARYQGGTYKSLEITWKGQVIPASGENISLTATTSRDYYLSLMEATNQKLFKKVGPDDTFYYETNEGVTTSQGDVYHLYGVKWLKTLDMSNWGGYEYVYFNATMPTLERFILGGNRSSSETVGNLLIGNTMPSLKYLDITNIKVTNIDLTGCIYLEELIASGSKLASVSLAEGCNIQRMVLPETLANLSLIALPKLTLSGLEFENSDNILTLRVENCDSLNGLDLLDTLLSSETNNLRYVRITNINKSDNGQDLIKYKSLGLGGLDSNNGTIAGRCKLIGTYELTTLLDNNTYQELCEYFDELNIIQPEYTKVSFNLGSTTPNKITNYDNNTGYNFSNTYVPSGHILNVLNKRHSYLVKNQNDGVFAAMQLDDANSTKYIDNKGSLLDGSEGDYCMYEPHYWYKGINDHRNKMMYYLISSNEKCPHTANGQKITLDDCKQHTGYKVNATTSTSESNVLISNSTSTSYIAYSYILPSEHSYKQFRVSSVSHSSTGCVVVDKDGNILTRLSADANSGMHDNSYLFTNLPSNAYKIYFTVSTDNISDYCIYLTESSKIEDIEPDWVEHKECFIGRVMSTLYNGTVQSAIYQNANDINDYYYPYTSTDSEENKVINICTELQNRGVGYYAADYEVLKDIIILSYLKYGRTDLHNNCVGAGYDSSNRPTFAPSFRPGNINYTIYGIQDTLTTASDNTCDSYYAGSVSNVYPYMATLMGYHQFIGQGSTISNKDSISMNNKMYINNRTGRRLKIYTTTTTRYNRYIIGGRYMDIFGTNVEGLSSEGFCSKENLATSSGTGLLEFGYKVAVITGTAIPVSYSLSATADSNSETKINAQNLARLQRVLIIPNQINYYNDSDSYKAL